MGHNGQVVAYLRVSSDTQQLHRQEGLKQGADKVYEEIASAATRQRPVLEEMLAYVREGDTVRVASMDRLARSLGDLDSIVKELKTKGVTIEFLKERIVFDPRAEAEDDPMKVLLFQILGSFAQFERSIIRSRQKEGIAKAKAAGKYKGRAPSLTSSQIKLAEERVALGVPKAQVARELGVSRQTLYRGLAGTLTLRKEPSAL